jgi:hypothetical protein
MRATYIKAMFLYRRYSFSKEAFVCLGILLLEVGLRAQNAIWNFRALWSLFLFYWFLLSSFHSPWIIVTIINYINNKKNSIVIRVSFGVVISTLECWQVFWKCNCSPPKALRSRKASCYIFSPWYITGTCWVSRESFFENHSSFYTLCKGIRSGLHWKSSPCKGDTSIHLRKRDKDAQCTELVEWGGGERGSKDNNYKGRVNKVRK